MSAIDDNLPTCRYCLETTPPLLSPCRCAGTQAYIHVACQEQAYKVTGSYCCPVCLVQFTNVEFGNLEYIPSEEGDDSPCMAVIGYFLPIINMITPLLLYPSLVQAGNFHLYTDKAQLFALYELGWQIILISLILSINIGCRVRQRAKYIRHLLITPRHNYLAFHLLIVMYLAITMWRAEYASYQFLLIGSQCITHLHERQHEYILQLINTDTEAVRFLG